ncbi:MAG: hypothetical protein AAGJ35_03660, partial [Myxococcota bacterium]
MRVSKKVRWFGLFMFYIGVVPFAKFWRFWMLGSREQWFMNGDVYHEYWPDMHIHVEALRLGDWAIYNPFMNYGFPMVSDPQNGVYYPISWIYLVAGLFLDHAKAFYVFEWITLVPVGILGLGMHLYLRRIQCSEQAAFLGAIIAMSSGFVNRAYYLKFMQAFVWIPWLMLVMEMCLERISLRRAVLLGAVVGTSVLAGGPPGVFYLVLWCGVYFAFRSFQEWRRGRWSHVLRVMCWLPLSVVVASALGAVVFLPVLDVVGTTVRKGVG